MRASSLHFDVSFARLGVGFHDRFQVQGFSSWALRSDGSWFSLSTRISRSSLFSFRPGRAFWSLRSNRSWFALFTRSASFTLRADWSDRAYRTNRASVS